MCNDAFYFKSLHLQQLQIASALTARGGQLQHPPPIHICHIQSELCIGSCGFYINFARSKFIIEHAAQKVMWPSVLLICSMSCCGCQLLFHGAAATLPNTVQLGGAIVAAVEDDVHRQQAAMEQQKMLQQQADEVQALLPVVDTNADVKALKHLVDAYVEGRGKFRKRRKMLRYLYPLLIGILIVKTVVLPLTLKALTALSTSSFVMSKIALVAAGLLTLKWLLASSGGSGGGYGYDGSKERTHLEIVHLPAFTKSYQKGVAGGGWDDLSYSGSGLLNIKAKRQQQQQYIPLGKIKDEAGVALDNYRYTPQTQHNYNAAFDGKPFL